MSDKLKSLEQDWIKQFDKPLVIGGPCSAESEEQILKIADDLDKDYVQGFRAGIWKPRTKPGTFEGVGAIGLGWMKKVKEKYPEVLLSTEVASAEHVKLALEADLDILWLGARTTVNPFLVQEIAEALGNTDKIVLVKNPVNPDLELWIGALQRLANEGVTKLGVIHRGFSTAKKTIYRNPPMWQIALEFKNRYPNIPVFGDPSHIAGNRELIADLCQRSFNFKFDGLIVETHFNPDEAWSDAKQQITPERLLEILKACELRKNDEENITYKTKLEALRHDINDIDSGLLETLAERMKVASQIGELKKEHNVAVFQPGRFEDLLANLQKEGAQLGLSEELIKKVIDTLHSESVDIQNNIMNA